MSCCFNTRHWLAALLLTLCALLMPAQVHAELREQQRQHFLLAEKLLQRGQEGEFLTLSRTLTAYPLYPYLQYQWLKNNLPQTDAVRFFLLRYQNTRYAELLRQKWLGYLADNQRWPEFVQQYQPVADVALQCQYFWALHNTGAKQRALEGAKQLWLSGDTLPKACDALLFAFSIAPEFNQLLVWQRFEQALSKDNVALASYLRTFIEPAEQTIAEQWLKAHRQPARVLPNLDPSRHTLLARGYAHGVERLAESEPDLAIRLWDSRKNPLALSTDRRDAVERKLALALAYRFDDRAYRRLGQLARIDDPMREWQIRVALHNQNWRQVADALAGLTASARQQPIWQYWQARSLAALGDNELALSVYQKLAQDRSFYGFLAADAINQPYRFNNQPAPVTPQQLAALADEPDFKTVHEFIALDRELDARRQWWYAVDKLAPQQRIVAAKLAQHWQWQQIAIITLVKADYWDDLNLRFPVRYQNEIRRNANLEDLEPALLHGLIRQESMWDSMAVSSAGARGLMQIMPATGRQLAQELRARYSAADLFKPDVNIRYGSRYFKKLLHQFAGHAVLAIAAYNAGPQRVKTWLPGSDAVAADIWLETLPFKETRKYVASVLSYAIIYQHLLADGGARHATPASLKLKNLLKDVVWQ